MLSGALTANDHGVHNQVQAHQMPSNEPVGRPAARTRHQPYSPTSTFHRLLAAAYPAGLQQARTGWAAQRIAKKTICSWLAEAISIEGQNARNAKNCRGDILAQAFDDSHEFGDDQEQIGSDEQQGFQLRQTPCGSRTGLLKKVR